MRSLRSRRHCPGAPCPKSRCLICRHSAGYEGGHSRADTRTRMRIQAAAATAARPSGLSLLKHKKFLFRSFTSPRWDSNCIPGLAKTGNPRKMRNPEQSEGSLARSDTEGCVQSTPFHILSFRSNVRLPSPTAPLMFESPVVRQEDSRGQMTRNLERAILSLGLAQPIEGCSVRPLAVFSYWLAVFPYRCASEGVSAIPRRCRDASVPRTGSGPAYFHAFLGRLSPVHTSRS